MKFNYLTPLLMAISFMIAIFTSYNAVSMDYFLSRKKKVNWHVWIVLKALGVSFGIWGMHFISMISFQHAVFDSYNTQLVILSGLVVFIGTYGSFLEICSPKFKSNDLTKGTVMFGTGLILMHYIGMAAMMPLELEKHPIVLLVSLIIGYVSAYLTMKAIRIEHHSFKIIKDLKQVLILAVGIFSFHYLGMFGMMTPHSVGENHANLAFLSVSLSSMVVLAEVLLIFSSLISYIFDTNRLEISKLKDTSLALLKSNPDPVFLLNTNGELVTANEVAIDSFQLNLEKDREHPVRQFMRDEDYTNAVQCFQEVIEMGTSMHLEEQIKLKTNEYREFKIKMIPVVPDNHIVMEVFIIAIDVTEENEMKRQIRQIAYHDSLTNLPNRYYMNEFVHQELEIFEKNYDCTKKNSFVIFYIDLNELKKVNDTLGHHIGDAYLENIAKRMRDYIGHHYFLARTGGDEFALIYIEKNEAETREVTENLLRAFDAPLIVEKMVLNPTASIGVVKAFEDGSELEELLKKADIAMFSAKQEVKNSGKTMIVSYSDYQVQLKNDYQKELELIQGIENQEFILHYQPKVYADSGRFYGVEGLIRWQVTGEDRLRYPDEFIPLSEKTGHILELTKQLVEMSVKQIKCWLTKGYEVPISVNVSAEHFQEDELVALIEELLKKYQIPPYLLELEITETVLMEDVTESKNILWRLHRLGVHLSVDDFGTGYSSLRYLMEFPIQSLKIDRSFTEAMNIDKKVFIVTETIIQLAQKLDLQIIVEGVETKEQLATLNHMGNFLIQGYYFSKPIPYDEIEETWLKK
ncbi:EAL domain-containing protein [Carnobacterium divergens]|uniref:EAL domain-containing protein n=1 Tax=Carnobacterium divergens TaxID=2748 RepID=A0AAW8R8K8_CARDV|nr:EAL domain-containing protein [Carnobacterium divergens]MDT1957225.1 EAL domain-containing protein [Carnobacterium divergens]MDT1973195.1 EAL domain-containing protein [Carnobacterium divergens]